MSCCLDVVCRDGTLKCSLESLLKRSRLLSTLFQDVCRCMPCLVLPDYSTDVVNITVMHIEDKTCATVETEIIELSELLGISVRESCENAKVLFYFTIEGSACYAYFILTALQINGPI